MNEEKDKKVIDLIKHAHFHWYELDLDDRKTIIALHRCMEDLFNYAGITSTLGVNNPGAIMADDLVQP